MFKISSILSPLLPRVRPPMSQELGIPELVLKDSLRPLASDAGIAVVEPSHLLATHQQLAIQLHFSLELPPDDYRDLIQPTLLRLTEWVCLLPASAHHHHRQLGGLLHHSLDCAARAARRSQDRLFTGNSGPHVRRVWEKRWRVATVMAALLHDVGKVVTDMYVTAPTGALWSAATLSLWDWSQQQALESYHVGWHANRHGHHETAATVVAKEILGERLISWLTHPGQDAFLTLWKVLGGHTLQNTHSLPQTFLATIVKGVDSASVKHDLATNGASSDQVALSLTPEWQIVHAMRRLVDQQVWTINKPGARVWVLREGVFIAWEAGHDELMSELNGVHGYRESTDPAALADRLIAARFAITCLNASGVYRYWLISPSCLGKVKLKTLRLLNPSLLFSDGKMPQTHAAVVCGHLPGDEHAPADQDAPDPDQRRVSEPPHSPARQAPLPPPQPAGDAEPGTTAGDEGGEGAILPPVPGRGKALLAALFEDWKNGRIPADAIMFLQGEKIFIPYPGHLRTSFKTDDLVGALAALERDNLILRRGSHTVHMWRTQRGLWLEPDVAKAFSHAKDRAGKQASRKSKRPTADLDPLLAEEITTTLCRMACNEGGVLFVSLSAYQALLKRLGVPRSTGTAFLDTLGATYHPTGRIILNPKMKKEDA